MVQLGRTTDVSPDHDKAMPAPTSQPRTHSPPDDHRRSRPLGRRFWGDGRLRLGHRFSRRLGRRLGIGLGRPGYRAVVVTATAVIVATTAFVAAENVSAHLARAATTAAVDQARAVVQAFVDPVVVAGALTPGEGADGEGPPGSAPGSAQGSELGQEEAALETALNAALERLVASSSILRVKVWTADGTVRYSDLAELRGQRFEIGEDLAEALAGETVSEITAPEAEENVFERGLADQVLEVYLPILAPAAQPNAGLPNVVGAYELYQDAAPLLAQIDATRREVALIVGGAGVLALGLVFASFSGAARLLARRNESLRRRARREAELAAEIQRRETRFRSLIGSTADIVAVADAAGTILYASPALERTLGRRVAEHLGRPIVSLVHPDDLHFEARLTAVATSPGAEARAEVRLAHADGSYRNTEVTVRNELTEPSIGGLVLTFHDVTDRTALEGQLRRQLLTDPLTGLPNRAVFRDRLEQALLRLASRRGSLAVLLVDLDDFRTVNDTLGHAAGDELLEAVGRRLRGALGAGDTLARLGADEFAVLLELPGDDGADGAGPGASGPPGIETADALHAALRSPFLIGGREIFVRASMGLATAGATMSGAAMAGTATVHTATARATMSVADPAPPEETPTADDLLRQADIAMAAAKQSGKSRTEIFTSAMQGATALRLALRNDLEGALERGEFRLVYQPIVDLATGRPDGVEALVRWQHPARGLVPPSEFIPLAEESGLIVELGRWVVERALRDAVAWRASLGRLVRVNLNLSPRELREPDVTRALARRLEAAGYPATALTLEVTESALVDERVALARLGELRALGLRLAIDDFGSGYSSLAYLRRLPVSEVKIDRSFVAGLTGDGPASGGDGSPLAGVASAPTADPVPRPPSGGTTSGPAREVVRSIVELARALELDVVAEGIETAGQATLLRTLGVARGQGYHLARPMPSDELVAWLARPVVAGSSTASVDAP